MDVGWGEFDRTTTSGLGEVRAMLRMNFWDGTNADTSRGWYLMSGLARMKSRNNYVEFINRKTSYYNVIEVQELLSQYLSKSLQFWHFSLINCQQQNHSNDTWGKK